MKIVSFKGNMSGFTLIEMIITIAIMGILVTIAIASMSGSRAAARVEAAQKEVESEIALAKAYALQGKTQNDGGDMKTPCGYGVYFSSETEYHIFYNFLDTEATANVINDCDDFNGIASNRDFYEAESKKMPLRKLSGGVTSDASGTEIYFTVPNARVYNMEGVELTSDIVFSLTAGEITKSVSVNKFGQITIGK